MKKLGLLVMPFVAISLLASCEEGNSPSYHTVSFYSNGGSPVEPQRIEDGKTATKPDPAPTKDGYNEPIWEDENGKEFNFSTKITSDITLYADWGDPITYTITYENLYDAGNINFTTYNVEYGFVLENPIYDDYAFDFKGWYILKDGVPTQISEIKKGTIGDLTIYAVWNDDKQYNITYENLGVATTDNPTKYNPVTTDSFTLKEPTDGGYKFTGWHLGSPDGMLIEEFYPLFFAKEIKIYASWDNETPIKYNITYENLLGAKTDNKTSYTIETDTFTLNNPTTDNGYKFTGWHLGSLEGEVITQIEQGTVVGHLHIYASWGDPINYTITYVLDGGTPTGNPTYYNVTQSIVLNGTTLDGFVFNGWYLAPNEGNKFQYQSGWGAGQMIGNLTLYADWHVADKTLESYEWKDIDEISKGKEASKYFNIGDTKTVNVYSKNHTVRIIDFDHDDLADGTAKAGITFEFVNVITDSNGAIQTNWNDKDGDKSTNYNFPESTLNNFLNNNSDCILTKLPPELQGSIKEVCKPVAFGENYELKNDFITKLFPLSYREMTQSPSEYAKEEGSTYAFYQGSGDTNENRIKKAVNGTDYKLYWVRSPCTYLSECPWYVITNGILTYNDAVDVYRYWFAVAPAFCI